MTADRDDDDDKIKHQESRQTPERPESVTGRQNVVWRQCVITNCIEKYSWKYTN